MPQVEYHQGESRAEIVVKPPVEMPADRLLHYLPGSSVVGGVNSPRWRSAGQR